MSVFAIHPPTLLALSRGVIATWWAGVIVSILLVIAARRGSHAKMSARQLVPLVFALMAGTGACAVTFGFIGYAWANVPPEIAKALAGGQAFGPY